MLAAELPANETSREFVLNGAFSNTWHGRGRWRVFAVATAQDQNRFINEDWFRRTLDFDAPHRNARDRFDLSFKLKG